MHRLRMLGILTACVVCAPLAALAQVATGNWELSITLPQVPSTMTRTVTQSGKAITGTMSSPFGSSPMTGTVSGTDITLTAELNVGRALPLTFKGKVAGDAFIGSLQTAGMGESPVTGKRANAGAPAAGPAAAPAVPPASAAAGIAV